MEPGSGNLLAPALLPSRGWPGREVQGRGAKPSPQMGGARPRAWGRRPGWPGSSTCGVVERMGWWRRPTTGRKRHCCWEGRGPGEDPGSLRRRGQVLVGEEAIQRGRVRGTLGGVGSGLAPDNWGPPGKGDTGTRGGFLPFPLPSPEAPQTKGSPAPALALSPRKPHHHGQEPRVPV